MPRLRPPPTKDAISQRQKALWEGLDRFIREHGGWVTSIKDVVSPIRFECRAASELPSELRRLGYDVTSAGIGERSLPIIETMSQHGRNKKIQREQIGLVPVEIFEFNLPI
jgi:hypothetical protein